MGYGLWGYGLWAVLREFLILSAAKDLACLSRSGVAIFKVGWVGPRRPRSGQALRCAQDEGLIQHSQ